MNSLFAIILLLLSYLINCDFIALNFCVRYINIQMNIRSQQPGVVGLVAADANGLCISGMIQTHYKLI